MVGQRDLDQARLDDLARRFGSAVDEANGKALALLATEVSRLEPALWQGKPAHDLLDLVGVPRAGVFSPYSLNERLLVLLRRHPAPGVDTNGHVSDVAAVEEAGVDVEGEPGAAEEDEGVDVEGEPGAAEEDEGVDVEQEPGAAMLVDAIEALDHAAREEAELTHLVSDEPRPADVALVGLGETLEGIRTELAALRQLVEALGERLGRLEDSLRPPGPAPQETEPPVAEGAEDAELEASPEAAVGPASETEAAAGPETRTRRSLRRVLLLILLVMLGVALAGVVVLIVIYLWAQVRSQVNGVLHTVGGLIT